MTTVTSPSQAGAHPAAFAAAAPAVAPAVAVVGWRLGLRRGTVLETQRAPVRSRRLVSPVAALTLKELPPGVDEALAALAAGDCTEDDLAALVTAGDGDAGLLRWHLMVGRLSGAGMLEHSVHLDGSRLARLVPVGRGRSAPGPLTDPTGRVRLSRFAVATVDDGPLLVRAPDSPLAVELGPQGAALLAGLTGWTSPAALAALPGGLPLDAVRQVLRLFAAAGLLSTGALGSLAGESEPEPQRSAQWSSADLWFHSRTRGPDTVAGYGGTYPSAGRFTPEPASPEPFPGERIALPVPDLEAAAARETPFAQLLDDRRSVRDHNDAAPLTVSQLGELLYRSMRRRQTFTGSDGQELADRPYPSGGAVHELEVYPLVTSCAGMEPGLWHYATDRHELERVAEPGPATAALVAAARESSLMTADPQVLLLVTARFGRVMWKYETVAYPLILKHVGVLYQTFYLVGAAMGLAVCGLGGGDAADFATASGIDRLTEGSVGELIVGSVSPAVRQDIGVPRRGTKR
jgi:SagB-type dehydrogenase family enzyme